MKYKGKISDPLDLVTKGWTESALAAKQDALESGTNIKTINGTSILGSGNITTPNTTYSAGTGISLSGTTFSNSGVRSITTGGSNGTISVNTNGTSADVAVKGLGSAAYTASTAYAAASHTHTKSQITDFPTIPTVNNPTITITQAGATKGTFTLNQSGNTTIALTDTIPTVNNPTITITQAGTTKGTFTLNQSGNTTIALTDNNTTYNVATTSADGLMSASDKSKLDRIISRTYSNIIVDVTPSALSTYNEWDTEQKYGYSATITVSGLTTNSLIQNLVMTDTLLDSVACIVTTTTNGLIFYTEDATALSGTIYTLVVSEVS